MRLVLVRHGETTANVGKLFCGHTDVSLTEKGLNQAEDVAVRLKDYTFTKIISSDLRRAYKTASAINVYHKLPIYKEMALREMNFGSCEGYTYKELTQLKPHIFTGNHIGDWHFQFPNGESLELMSGRIMTTLEAIRKESSTDDVVLVVAHAGVIRMILALEVACIQDSYWRFDIDNCGVVELKYFDDFCMIKKLNG